MGIVVLAGAIGSPEIIVIGIIVLILFGASKVKEFSRSIGQSVGEFKGGLKQGERVAKEAASDPPQEADPPDQASESEGDEPDIRDHPAD
ncbi:twin-arginine translocase TatA/TatE family subunit [bacterium]|nr:twin-arginine translocase TatA/TatE family subunit [bacterium]